MRVGPWFRQMRRDAAASTTSIAILALGISANIVVFQTVDRLVLNPLPLPDGDQIVVIGSERPRISQPLSYFEALSGPEIDDIVRSPKGLTALLPFDLNSVRTTGGDFPVRLFGAFIWSDPLPLLGVDVALGRGIGEAEIERGDRVALLSHAAWTRDFAGDPTVIDRTLSLDGEPYVVVGVLPPYASIYGVDVWLPSREPLADLDRNRRQFNLLARLGPGHTYSSVNADLQSVASRVEALRAREFDAYTGWRLSASSFANNSASAFSDEALLTLVAALMVLALICVNLGNLALVRSIQAGGEIATRLALGSGRRRLALHAATEAGLLAAIGGGAGIVMATLSFAVLNQRLPGILRPSGPPLALEASGLLFGLAVSAAAGVILACAAIGAAWRTRPRDVLLGGRGSTGSKRLRSVQRALVTVQLALGLTLASGAGAVGGAVARVLMEEPGFDLDGLVSMRVSLPPDSYVGDAVPTFFEAVLARVRGIPGAGGASMATQVAPNTIFSSEIEVQGTTASEDQRPRVYHTVIGDDYFATMGIELVRGRAPDARDVFEGLPVAVLNEAAVERFYPGEEPIGKRLRIRGTRFDSGWAEVIGVSRSVRHRGQASPPSPEVFTAHRQAGGRYSQMFLIARAERESADIVPEIRAEVLRIDPAQPVYAIGTPQASMAQQVAPRRLAAYLLLVLAGVAVSLAGLGLHGVLAYTVATRSSDFAVRAALGANPQRLARSLMLDAARTTGLGIAAGIALTAWLGWLLRTALGEAASWNPAVVLAATLVLGLAAATSVIRPARALLTTNPADALRQG